LALVAVTLIPAWFLPKKPAIQTPAV
jgi:hypothetical protein